MNNNRSQRGQNDRFVTRGLLNLTPLALLAKISGICIGRLIGTILLINPA